MAIQLSSAQSHEPMLEINTTPLIDVMLVLLVMLIITMPAQLDSVRLNLPTPQNSHPINPPPSMKIDIQADGQLFWQGQPVDAESLDQALEAAHLLNPQPIIQLRTDKHASYGQFVKILNLTKTHHIDHLAVIGAEQFIH